MPGRTEDFAENKSLRSKREEKDVKGSSSRDCKDELAIEGAGTWFNIGGYVERIIEDMWFVARVERIDEVRQQVTLRYVDDDNIEERVPFDDIRTHQGGVGPHEFTTLKRIDTLPKPLAGLVEDDTEERRAHRPTVVIHSNPDSEEAIIMNGAENQLAAGGGLRALRYLKKGDSK